MNLNKVEKGCSYVINVSLSTEVAQLTDELHPNCVVNNRAISFCEQFKLYSTVFLYVLFMFRSKYLKQNVKFILK